MQNIPETQPPTVMRDGLLLQSNSRKQIWSGWICFISRFQIFLPEGLMLCCCATVYTMQPLSPQTMSGHDQESSKSKKGDLWQEKKIWSAHRKTVTSIHSMHSQCGPKWESFWRRPGATRHSHVERIPAFLCFHMSLKFLRQFFSQQCYGFSSDTSICGILRGFSNTRCDRLKVGLNHKREFGNDSFGVLIGCPQISGTCSYGSQLSKVKGGSWKPAQ